MAGQMRHTHPRQDEKTGVVGHLTQAVSARVCVPSDVFVARLALPGRRAKQMCPTAEQDDPDRGAVTDGSRGTLVHGNCPRQRVSRSDTWRWASSGPPALWWVFRGQKGPRLPASVPLGRPVPRSATRRAQTHRPPCRGVPLKQLTTPSPTPTPSEIQDVASPHDLSPHAHTQQRNSCHR